MSTSPDRHAALEERDGRSALRFERLLPHPPERVWSALTSPRELASWHPTPFALHWDAGEPGRGGRVAFDPPAHVPKIPDGRVLEYDPPRLLAYTWWEDELRWELEPRGGGCLLTLTHTFDDRFKAARDAAGWDLCLLALTRTLAGEADTSQGDQRIPDGWAELNADYQRRFGISPEQATPPPVV
jgi:uncharacterized protein YndB with AHSA1/START domain